MEQKHLLTALLAALLVAGCTSSTSTETSFGLDIGDSTLAVENATGQVEAVTDATFTQGDRIYLVLSNIDGFQQTDAGDYAPQANLTVTGPDGETVASGDQLLSSDLGSRMQSSTLPSLSTHWQSSTDDPEGQYTFEVVVYDSAGSGTATKSMAFQLQAAEDGTDTGDTGQETSTASLSIERMALGAENATGSVTVADDNTYAQGENVYMLMYNVGPLQLGDDDLYEFDASMELVADNGTVVSSDTMIFGESGHREFEDAAIGELTTGVTTDGVSAGSYTAEVTVFDQVAGTQTEASRPVVIE